MDLHLAEYWYRNLKRKLISSLVTIVSCSEGNSVRDKLISHFHRHVQTLTSPLQEQNWEWLISPFLGSDSKRVDDYGEKVGNYGTKNFY